MIWIWLLLFGFLLYIYMRLSCGITKSAACLVGKTAIVTGANSGIGYQTALNLASRGCKVIMADVVDMTNSRLKMIKYTNNNNILTKYLDLSSLESVRKFALAIIKTEDRLDILINNAGIGVSRENRTKDGLHPVMQINYFGHFLLTHLLIGLLKKSAPSRVVWTSSSLALFHNLTIENLNLDDKHSRTFNKILSYTNSKFAVLMASDLFAEKLQGTEVTSNSIHPGFVATPIMGKTYPIIDNVVLNLIMKIYMKLYAKLPWEGSQVLVHVAISKKLEGVTGRHFWDCKPFLKPRRANDGKFRQSLWNASEKLVQLREDERL